MIRLNDMAPRELIPGFFGKFIHGEKSSLVFWDIREGSVMPEHFHEHEQITHILEGELEMVIGGRKYTFTSGTVHVIPSNTPHSAVAVKNSKVIDSFSPARSEYR